MELGKLDQMNALKLRDGTIVGPVTMICATLAFLGVLACFLILFLIQPAQADVYVRSLIPVLASVGATALIWFKAHTVQQRNTEENVAINSNVITAAKKADDASAVATKVAEQVDGQLETKIECVLNRVLSERLVGAPAPMVTEQGHAVSE